MYKKILFIFILLFSTQFYANIKSVEKKNNTKESIHLVKKKSNHIYFSAKERNYKIEIYDVMGQMILQTKVCKGQGKNISIHKIELGKYYVRYISDRIKNNYVEKLYIQ